MLLDVNKIGYDPRYYPRVNGSPDWMTVLRYTEALEFGGDPFPPIIVVRATGKNPPYLLIDGLHRLRAYVKAQREGIPVTVERIPQSKWLPRSVELNSVHGRPLDTGDKAWIATRLEEDGWKRTDIAGLLKMKVDSLERIVSSRCVRISDKMAEKLPEGRSNRKVNGNHVGFLKKPLIGASGSRAVYEALESQHSVTSHDVLAILDSMISVLRSGVVSMADEETVARVKTIKKLLRSLTVKQ